ncbi:MAG: hypothetical protein ACM31C_01750 [Acidobacteriota bacterium]
MKRFPWLLALVACGASRPVPGVRYANAPAVTAVDDRRDVPNQPERRTFFQHLYHYDGTIQRRLVRAMELPPPQRAQGVNALDEVPDSTWFTNRIGQRDLSLDELRAGPARIDSPELHKPWTITSTKPGGTEIGFVFKDARGIKFLLKFDPAGFPEQETATHVIVGKLLWACGYNTTEDFVVKVRRDDLVLAPDARIKDDHGDDGKLDSHELDKRFAQIDIDGDGEIRGMASRWLDGKPIGGFPAEGVRDDDPNDRIPHELRRDLRGAYPIFAWLDHVDIQESNFLDTWAADPRDPRRHYVKHYLIDFGKSLGVMDTTGRNPRHGYDYVIDFAEMTRSLVTAGTMLRDWEGREQPKLRGIGLYTAAGFDPGDWKPDFPSYVPLLVADRIDKFWGTKILMRFTREQIRAIVETGRLSDPRATDYLVDTLVARQRATGAYWFSRTNPLDRFAVDHGRLCFDDLMLVYDLGPKPADTRYTITTFDAGEHPLARLETRPDARGHACTAALPLPAWGDGYTIARVSTSRPGFQGDTFVHLARDRATGQPRVIGIWRP